MPDNRRSTIVLGTAFAAMLLTALAAPTPAASPTPTSSAAPIGLDAAAPSPSDRRASKPRPTPAKPMAGERTVFKGTIGGGKRPVRLQRRQGKAWKTVASGATKRNGTYRLNIKARPGSYRVEAPRRGGSAESTSPSVRLRIARQRTTVVTLPPLFVAGLAREVRARVTPARAGRVVALQRRVGARWVDQATARSTRNGTARIRHRASAVGTFTYRVQARRFRGSTTSATSSFGLRAAANPELVSTGMPPTGEVDSLTISGDGLFMAFSTRDQLLPNDTDTLDDIYLFDRRTGRLTLLLAQANDQSSGPELSRTGRFLAFHTLANNLGVTDPESDYDVFVLDRRTGEVALVSANADGEGASGTSFVEDISGDGQRVAFTSTARDLVPLPPPNESVQHGYLYDGGTDTIRGLTRIGAGWSDQGIFEMALSGDGSRVAFASSDEDLDPGNVDGSAIFAWDIAGDGTISDRTNLTPDIGSAGPILDGDGDTLALRTSVGLDPADVDAVVDAYLRRPNGTFIPIGLVEDGDSRPDGLSDDGRFATIRTRAVVAGDNGDDRDAVLWDFTRASARLLTPYGPGITGAALLSEAGDVVALGTAAKPVPSAGSYNAYSLALR